MPAWFTTQDLFVVGFLVFLEGILSIDNALVLAMLARHLPKHLQKRALTYGLVGAIFFRLVALSMTTYLLQWNWVKFVGGGYLIFIALKHFYARAQEEAEQRDKSPGHFWRTVLVIELTDIAFAVDSILAAVALSNKFWVIFTGGIIGVALMRFAATHFIKFLDRFPRFEDTAYQLVFLIGTKVTLEGFHIPGVNFHDTGEAPFWIFWALMFIIIGLGFRPVKNRA